RIIRRRRFWCPIANGGDWWDASLVFSSSLVGVAEAKVESQAAVPPVLERSVTNM
ncbi:unnamed protein product, partial [Nesidiocoris tenuis]